MQLKFKVKEQTIEQQRTSSVPRRGSAEYLELVFAFSSDWDSLEKTIYFQHGEYSNAVLLQGDTIVVPAWYTQQESFLITFLGVDDVQTVPTNVVEIVLEESNEIWVAVAPDPESVDYQALMARIATLSSQIGDLQSLQTTNKTNLVEAINELWAREPSNPEPGGGVVPADVERQSNRVTLIDKNSDNAHYPTAKAVFDFVGNIEAALDSIIANQENYIAQSPVPVNEEVLE